MTQQQYIIQRKANILELGEKLGNISEACRKLGVSRQHFYDIKSAVEENGIEGLLEQSRRAPRIGNRVSSEIEQKILDYSLQWPTHGQVRVSNELLRNHAMTISPGGVRSVWMRHDLKTKGLRLKRLEKWSAGHGEVLTESQVQALENAKEEKQAHGEIESFHPVSIPMIADIDSGRSRTDFGAKRRKQLLFLRLSGISQAGHLLSQRIDRFDLKPMSIMEPAIEKCIGDPATP